MMTRSILFLALFFLSTLVLSSSLVYANTQMVVAKTQIPLAKGGVQQTSVVVASIDQNGHVAGKSSVVFAGREGHSLNYPSLSPNGDRILFSYSPDNTGNLLGATMIYEMSVKDSNATRLTNNDRSNITEVSAVFGPNGTFIAYNAAMASSWYGVNVSNSQRLAISRGDGSKFEWLFIPSMPFQYEFDQWCQVFDPISGDLYFYSDFCSESYTCLYRYSFEENKATEVLKQLGNSCPRPIVFNGTTLMFLPQTNDGITAFGVVDQNNFWTQLFEVDLVVAENVYDADQFFDCQPMVHGKLVLCTSELGRSIVLITWDGTGIVSTVLVGDYNEGIVPESGYNTLYNSASVLI
jgi:hypothetical protein